MGELGIHFGAMCEPIKEQIEKQGRFIPGEDADRFQRLADAITILNLNGILSDGITHKCHRKLLKKIVESVCEVEK